MFARNKKKMLPIINRGTWTRVHAIRQVLLRFIKANAGANQKVNVVSLGAGYDSTYFWLRQHHGITDATLDYIELDFSDVIKKKLQTIKSQDALKKLVWGEEATTFGNREGSCLSDNELDAPGYKLIAGDVRDDDIMKGKLTGTNVDGSLPTLIITECILIYMRADDTHGVLRWTKEYFGEQGDLAYLNYEMINPDDQFGRMMVENLENRGCQLLGIHDCPSLDA